MDDFTKRTARMGALVALSMLFSYIEGILPFSIGIPGVRIGFANVVVVTALYLSGWRQAGLVSVVRIILMGLLFGNGMSLLYSLAGGVLSFLVMALLHKNGRFSVMGVSVAGGVSHNVGQLLVAAFVVQNVHIFYYMAVLLAAGVCTGFLIGLLCRRIITRMRAVHIDELSS